MPFSIDIEVTNRCNAKCHFCPRDRTPHQGLMEQDVFDKALERAVEYRQICLDRLGGDAVVSLCGLGEPLLNRNLARYVAQVRAAGMDVTVSSNGALLTEERGRELLDAGLQNIFLNIGEEGEAYDEVYQLPFEKTRENVVRFAAAAEGRCEVTAVLVDHRSDPAHIARMSDYWSANGVKHSTSYEVMNRGGSLFVDHMQYESYPELADARRQLMERGVTPLCGAPFAYLFIGYDGQYYLCCSDWEKQAPMGSVFDLSFLEVTQAKIDHVVSRDPVCRTCNLDPINMLTEIMRAEELGQVPAGSAAQRLDDVAASSRVAAEIVEKLGIPAPRPGDLAPPRRFIPVSSDQP